MTTLIVGDQVLDYNEVACGAGDATLIFIHGIISSQYCWLDFPQSFARYGRVLTLTLPGHYPARFPTDMPAHQITDRWVGEIMAEAVRQLSGGRPTVLVGHSTGGYSSLATALCAPACLRGVVSLAGFVHGRWGRSVLGMAQRLQLLGYVGDRLFDALILMLVRNATAVDAAWRQFPVRHGDPESAMMYRAMQPLIMSHVGNIDPRAMRLWFYQMYRVADLTPHLPSISVPVLIMAGNQDQLVPMTEAACMQQLIPDNTYRVLDGASHFLYIDQPEQVRTHMCAWLDTLLS